MKRHIILGVLLLVCLSLKATIVQKIYLKNGSVLSGYIQQQDGKGQMVVHTDEAVICLKNAGLSIQESQQKIANCSAAWQKWAENHPDFITYDGQGNKVLNLQTILFGRNAAEETDTKNEAGKNFFEENLKKNHQQFYFVRILEKGPTVKFLELTPKTYSVKWADIEKITSERRPTTTLSGQRRCYTLKSGQKVQGEYAGETEQTVSLFNDNGYIETIRFAEVAKINVSPINPDQTIFQQSALWDDIQTKNGIHYTGVITEYNYTGKTDAENFISIQDTTNMVQHIKVSDIASISKMENTTQYNPLFDIILKKGEIVVNRKPTQAVKVLEDGDILSLDSLSHKVQLTATPAKPTEISIEYHSDNASNIKQFQLVKTSGKLIKKKTVYYFSYKDLVNKVILPLRTSTSINHTTKVTYSLPGKGIYALYDAGEKKAIPIIVK